MSGFRYVGILDREGNWEAYDPKRSYKYIEVRCAYTWRKVNLDDR